MIKAGRWQDLGNDDPRMPPAYVVEIPPARLDPSALEDQGLFLPRQLLQAVPARQSEFLMGRLAARHAIERLGVAASMPGIGPSREPRWQRGVTGSITHTSGIAGAVAVPASTVSGIGIDIEHLLEGEAREVVGSLAVTAEERALLAAHGAPLSADVLLTVAFSAKESFFKGTFAAVGRYFDFDAVRVSALEADRGRLTLTLRETLCPALPAGRSFPVGFTLLSARTVATSFLW